MMLEQEALTLSSEMSFEYP
ncbi:hypothetical protein [Bacillus sp. JCM 19034]